MDVQVVFWAVVLARFVLPFFILRYPLPAIIACLLLDGVDQTIFQIFDVEPPNYQSYDKAMDVFYLSIAYLASLRNWSNPGAVKISRFLFFYRQVGAVLFELTGLRFLLLIFPNTFEYFFIAYEGVRARRNPMRYGFRFWVKVAAGIWIFIKLPQETWIHILKLDLTDTIRDVPWFLPALIVALLILAAVVYFVIRPRLSPPDWTLRLTADPLPVEMDEASERMAYRAAHNRVLDMAAVEKIVLIGLTSVIYGRVLPGVQTSDLRLFLGIAFFVVLNSAIGLWSARRGYGWDSAAFSFLVLLVINIALVFVADLLLTRGNGDLSLPDTLYFVFLVTTLTMLYDRYHPVSEFRATAAAKAVS
ncbi:hypothetical protein [Kribbella sp. NPDC049584]|uniref:hypothetical protein n=1 Tax=Kribbella sp. NPDC049584 TaxID=3154833 RepID=UPI003429C472